MRLLLDENFPKLVVDVLRKEGHDVLWIRTHAPGMPDKDVLRLAAQERRVVLTLDKDFRYLSLDIAHEHTYGVILFRIHPAIPEKIVPVVLKTLRLDLQWLNHLGVVSEKTVQMIPIRRPSN